MIQNRLWMSIAVVAACGGQSDPRVGPASSGARVSGEFVARLADPTGLSVGTRVIVAGLELGQITSLEREDRKTLVWFAVRDEPEVWSNAVLTKKPASALGEYYLELDPGAADPAGRDAVRRLGSHCPGHDSAVREEALRCREVVTVVEKLTPEQATRRIEQTLPRAPSAIIELNELTVRFDGMPIARLYADGRTESVGNNKPGKDARFSPGPRLHTDGTIDLTRGGFKVRVEADGDIFVVGPPSSGQPEQLFGRIAGDQISTADSPGAGIRIDGSTIVMFSASKATNVIGMLDPPSMGRTALLMTAAFLIDMAITSR